MNKQVDDMIRKFIVSIDDIELLKQLMNDKSIKTDCLLVFIMEMIEDIHNEEKLQYLAEYIASKCLKEKSVVDIEHQINLINTNQNNDSKKIFIKRVLREICE